ncbi:AAA family ATPase [Bacteroides hominis]|uniref:DUF3696 domain-containing protein n=1 Tax=Bacteroides fragilis (strain YCH46) TaxID=295405 RepID=Q64VG0_BACFR|nr:DUF3696 domain-containing protein [Bacteroides fragilis]MCZ2530964.1 DUF3696 domain-containing protein [Bacteroides fragilis]BAD48516.1 conserved hypothetical protein [Bacteroides fragilis YCH46]
MITNLLLHNFKSHKKTDLKFSNLTVLTGINSAGKSSVIQSLLLLRQSHQKGRLEIGLDLNSPLCDLGKGNDVLFRFADSNIITFSISTEEERTYELHFDVKEKVLFNTFIPVQEGTSISPELFQLPLFTSNFQYLSALRWASRSLYPMDTYAVENEHQLSLAYGQGELVAHFLEYNGRRSEYAICDTTVLHPSFAGDNSLLAQTIAWEREISPRVNIKAEKKADQVSIEYGFEGVGNNLPLTNLRSENIGFGISYSLSVIVALLSARPGALLLIENPEAHLHPCGQAKLAELIALVSQTGVQVVIETHSDHIFNGIRRAIKNNMVDVDHVAIHYFKHGNENHTEAVEIGIEKNGRVKNYEEGLFDQFDKDLDELLGL